MTENPKLEDLSFDNLSSNCEAGDLGFNGGQKISISDHINGLQHLSTKSDSFMVDMERLSHLIEKDINSNSRITLHRNLSRKGLVRTGERKITSNERNSSMLATSPRATLHGGSMAALGTPDHSSNTQVHHQHQHHQITITSCSVSSTEAAESKSLLKRSSFRRSPPTWIIHPRRVLFFFATMSCIGTILLIYFTLSMGKLNEDGNAL